MRRERNQMHPPATMSLCSVPLVLHIFSDKSHGLTFARPAFFQQRRTRSEQRRGGRVPVVRHRREEHRPSESPVLLSGNVEIPRLQNRTNRKCSIYPRDTSFRDRHDLTQLCMLCFLCGRSRVSVTRARPHTHTRAVQYSKVPDKMLYSYMTCTVCIYSAITAGHVIVLPL